MKVFVVENNYGSISESKKTGWYVLADSAVTNTGKPFYKPDDYGKVKVAMAMAVKISRLGKSILPKFAQRYYVEMSPALHFFLPEYRKKLEEEGLSSDASVNFDRSLYVGSPQDIRDFNGLALILNGEEVAVWKIKNLKKSIENIISEISRMNTLKMGDLIIPGLSGEIEINEGDRLEVRNGEEIVFIVKVK